MQRKAAFAKLLIFNCVSLLYVILKPWKKYVKYEAHPEHGFRIVDQWTQDAGAAADGSPTTSASEADERKEDGSSSSSHRD